MSGELARTLEKHAAFWRGDGATSLRQVTEHEPLQDLGRIPLGGGATTTEGQTLSPDQIEPAAFYSSSGISGSPVDGEFLRGVGPPHLCWTEAIIGCGVKVVTGGPWAEPFLKEEAAPHRTDALRLEEAWLQKLEDFADFLVKYVDGNRPVVQPLMRGPVDMMASAMGHEAMCIALAESPGEAGAFLGFCADAFLAAARRLLEHSPSFGGGYLSSYGIWAPGTVVRNQIDNATMLSPKMYRDRVLPHDRRILEAFDYSLMHVHSGCLHVMDVLLEEDALQAVEVSIDYPGGPLVMEILPILERILEHKPLIVSGPVTAEELRALDGLDGQGRLCLRVRTY